MLKFKFLLWMLAKLLQRKINTNSECARYVRDKSLIFQIRTIDGTGRHYKIQNGALSSFPGLSNEAQFTLSFVTAAKGFEILSAKETQSAFLRGVGSKDLTISGNFLEVLWFQGLTDFLQPSKAVHPLDRTAF